MKVHEVTLTRGSILPMLADTAHVAECLGDKPAIGLPSAAGYVHFSRTIRARLITQSLSISDKKVNSSVT